MRNEGACGEIGRWKQNVWPHAFMGNYFPAAVLFTFTRTCAAVILCTGLLQQGPGAYLLLGSMLSGEISRSYIPIRTVVIFVSYQIRLQKALREVPVIQFKAHVHATTSSLKGFAEEISTSRLQG